MAIQKDLSNSQYGVPFTGAYFRIVTASVSRQRAEDSRHNVMIDVAGYANKPLNEDTKDIDFRRYYCSLTEIEACSGESFLSKCYVWVMAQDDMNGSEAI